MKPGTPILFLNGRPPLRLLERLKQFTAIPSDPFCRDLPVEQGPRGQAWSETGVLVAADGGANALWRARLPVEWIVGDLDSLEPEAHDWHKRHGAHIESRPDQQSNDLEKALELLAEDGVERCWVAGFEGERLDMLLGLTAYLDPQRRPALRLLGEAQVLIPLPMGQSTFPTLPEEGFSLISPGGPSHVTLRGAVWSGESLLLKPGCAAVSNRALATSLTVNVQDGCPWLVRRAPWAGPPS